MSIQEFREIFQREIDSHLGKLQRKSQDRGGRPQAAAGAPPPAGSAASAAVAEGFQEWELVELRRLANCMADSILGQLADHASYWELDGGGEADRDGASPLVEREARVRAAVAAEADAAHRQLESECAELERVLEQKKAEEERRREELAARLKAECEAAVQAKEQELLTIQQAAMSHVPGAGPAGSAEMVADMETHITRIHSRLATAKEAIARLESRRAGLEKIESLQSQPPSAAESLLAGAAAAGSARGAFGGSSKADEEQEAALLAAIQKGELVCKRMRRHFGGA